jgi:arylsulfatase A-like enzyme
MTGVDKGGLGGFVKGRFSMLAIPFFIFAMSYRFFAVFAFLLPFLLRPVAAADLDPEEERLGFVTLFDGSSFEGWEHGGNWVVEEGAFYRKRGGGSLTYVAETVPDDFELRFEWKASKGCNSGVYYRPGQVEYQVLDDVFSPYGENPRQAAASLFFCIGPDRRSAKPHDEWNSGRIVCKGTVIEHWLNEVPVISFDYADPKWKFEVDLLAVRGGDLTGRGGRLWLQDHGQDVWFRNLRWRVLPEDEPLEPRPDFVPLPVEGEALAKEQGRVRGMLAKLREAAPRPNFVVILADDLGWGDVAAYGPSPIATPQLDRLAAEGMRLTDAHSPSAICSPTRYGLLTGTDPFRRYHSSHVLFNGEPLVIGEGVATLASILAEAGYRTAVVGKWHLGLGDATPRDLHDPGRGPNELGFHESFLVPDGHNMLPRYYLHNGKPYGAAAGVRYPSRIGKVERVGYPLLQHAPEGDWPDHRPAAEIGATLVEKAVAFLEAAAAGDDPFFLYLPTCAIHDPQVPDPRFVGKSELGAHGDFVMEFDWTVGEIITALERLGVADDTLLIVTSDNGGLPGASKLGHRASGPWNGAKGSALEGGHRVPFLARWPGRIDAGSTSDALLSLTDLPATLAALGGGFVPPGAALDSLDQSPVLLGKAKSARASLMVATRGCEEFVRREGSEKIIYRPKEEGLRWTDLGEDPGEERLGPGPDDRAAAMLKNLRAYFARGSSRPRAVARGGSVEALLEERATLARERAKID